MPPIALTSVFVLVMTVALLLDVRTRRVPNWLTVGGFAAALLLRGLQGGDVLVDGGLGGGLGLLAALPLFLVGAFGGGDVKLLTAVGAFAGPGGLLQALLASGIIGGLIGVVMVARKSVLLPALLRTKDLGLYIATIGRAGNAPKLGSSPDSMKIPFGAAIAMGSTVVWFLPVLREFIA